MVTKTSRGYPRTKRIVEHAMKVVQRELEDSMLKVELLEALLKVREKLDGKE